MPQQTHVELEEFWSYQVAPVGQPLLPPAQGTYRPLANADADAHADALWLKMTLTNSSSRMVSRLLEIDDTHISSADLILVRPGAPPLRQQAGLTVRASKKAINLPQPVFTLSIEGGATAIAYLYLQSRDHRTLHSTLWTPQAFFQKQEGYTWMIGIALGVILVMAIYNLLVAVMARDPTFRLLGQLLTSILFLHLVVQGWGATYLWGEHPYLNTVLFGPAVTMAFISVIVFGRHFLSISGKSVIGRIMDFTIVINVLMFAVLTVNPAGALFTILMIANMPTVLLMLVYSASLWGRREHTGFQFLGAMAPLLISISIAVSNRALDLGISNAAIQAILLIGSSVIAISLALILADRIRRATQEQQSAYQELLLAQRHVRESESKAQAANRETEAKSAFLAIMSHEIRTPMNGILGMADLLTQTGMDQQQHYYLATLKRSGQALMRILNDVLDYSKVEAGRLELEAVEVNLIELLDDLMTLYREPLAAKGLRCYVLLDPHVPQWIIIDPTRLKQILNNLTSNAIKFTDNGEIRITISAAPRNRLFISVTDEGVGMEQGTLEGLFDRFQQADSSISRRYGGTGLGLAISKRLAELMGGHIEATTRLGEGSTFTFSVEFEPCSISPLQPDFDKLCVLSEDASLAHGLRLMAERWKVDFGLLDRPEEADKLTHRTVLVVDEDIDTNSNARMIRVSTDPLLYGELEKHLGEHDPQNHAPDVDEQTPLQDLQVMVAEDNATNRLIIGKILSSWGATVCFAENGVEARTLYAQSHEIIDLVIMDCEMPELDGYGATTEIRRMEADSSMRPVPIIALTAHVMPEFRRRAAAVGMSDYVTKPIERAVLLAAILKTTTPRRTEGPRSR